MHFPFLFFFFLCLLSLGNAKEQTPCDLPPIQKKPAQTSPSSHELFFYWMCTHCGHNNEVYFKTCAKCGKPM